ncbi:uncharacterized protein LOC120207708, partial [Hibiscus syriacus]|uniref:uncharacterized protein LOC120207708 n=1 Tax=Hibiscus syriacus TaxID=106335 RepID=UPI0019223347
MFTKKTEKDRDTTECNFSRFKPVLALDDSNRRRTLALYLLARVAQCAYNSAKGKNKFHLWGSHWNHGDSLLFALACAQVMYAFEMRPESLSQSYQDFIHCRHTFS